MIGLLLSLSTAWPCAALLTRITEAGALATSDAQEVILEQNDDGVITRYRVSYDGDASSFGWLIVTRGHVGEGDVTEADESLFDDLRTYTAPRLYIEEEVGSSGGGSGCSCMGTDKSSPFLAGSELSADFGVEDTGSIDITAEGFAGPFSYTALSATDTDALVTWLDENEFELGDTASSLDHYVEDGNYTFVAVTLTPDTAATPAEGRVLPALAIQSDAEQMEFPARLSYTGMAEELRTSIWVLGDNTAETIDGWGSVRLSVLGGGSDPSAAYDQMLRDTSIQDGRSYATVFSGPHGSQWVTRFDTLAHRSLHSEDPVFGFTPYTESSNVEIHVNEGYEHSSAWLWLPLFGLGIARRRRV